MAVQGYFATRRQHMLHEFFHVKASLRPSATLWKPAVKITAGFFVCSGMLFLLNVSMSFVKVTSLLQVHFKYWWSGKNINERMIVKVKVNESRVEIQIAAEVVGLAIHFAFKAWEDAAVPLTNRCSVPLFLCVGSIWCELGLITTCLLNRS